ncbi:MAG TPA: hypothetical protein VIS29_16615, partial [Streptomyces sp.]
MHRPMNEPGKSAVRPAVLRPVSEPPGRSGTPVDPAPVDPALVDPAVLTALLARHGWQRRGGVAGRYGRWTP